MFDKLIDLIAQFGRKLLPFTVVDPSKRAVVARLGKEHRQLDSGFHWLWPFGIEEAYYMSMATRIDELQPQSLVTKDGKNVVAGIIITYRVHDISKAIFSVWDAFTAATDACQATFAQAVLSNNFDYLRTPEFADELTKACRKQGFVYGFEIDKVRISELAPVRTYRLIGDGHYSKSA
jgi:regulator of protease activity HflC (stomatin/prohibitin superfamily)